MAARSRSDAAARLLGAARARGIDIGHEDAERWVAAPGRQTGAGRTRSLRRVHGHRVAGTGIDRSELGRLRWMTSVVGFDDRLPVVETALALSGAAAREPIPRVPDDPYFVQRLHLRADTRAEACGLLAQEVRRKVEFGLRGIGYRLVAVTFGTWPADATIDAGPVKRGRGIDWAPPDLATGAIAYRRSDGSPSVLRWEDAGSNPGCCRLDFVIADPVRGRLAGVTTVLFATWEAPSRSISPLDEFLEPYAEEVAGQIGSIPLFDPRVKGLSADAVAAHVDRLEAEIAQLTAVDAKYARAAPRLDTALRLIGHHTDATRVRELFDDRLVATAGIADVVQQVEQAADAGRTHEVDALVAQIDGLIMPAVTALDDRAEHGVGRRLLALRKAIGRRRATPADGALALAASRVMADVDDYFRRALAAIPTVATYLDTIASRRG